MMKILQNVFNGVQLWNGRRPNIVEAPITQQAVEYRFDDAWVK